MKIKSTGPLTFAWLLLALAGCATSGLLKVSKTDYPKAGPKNPVVRILGVWEPAMGIGLDNKTTRGFSGQIYFFSQGSDLAAKVDGDVRVYVFDDDGSAEDQMRALHEANFAADAWNAFLTKGPLGATYNVFIPYIRSGNHEAKCTLRIRYKPANGPVAYSDFVNIVLEGKKKPDAARDYDDAGARPKARARSNGSLPNQMADAAEARSADGPPRARGLAEAITASLELDGRQTRRPSAVALTDQERERIIREVRARMQAETNGAVALVAYDEADGQTVPARRKLSSRRPPNPLQDETESGDDATMETEAGENPDDPNRPIRHKLSAGRRHLLDDEDSTEEEGESSVGEDADDGADPGSEPVDDDQ
jgi:hypothetical protein